jgi:hypothetical protein
MPKTMTLFTFVPPSPTSKATGHTIARFVEKTLRVPLAWQPDQVADDTEVLGLMPGASAYCNCREELAEIIHRVPRVVWIQDDYTQRPPAIDSAAESPWRAAFRVRAERGLPGVDYWTTVKPNVVHSPDSTYVNWNSLGYEEMPPHEYVTRRTLFYYGVWRPGRKKFADRYFLTPDVETIISSKPGNEYSQRYAKCEHVPIMKRPELLATLRSHGLGLVLEDENSTRLWNSPPRRFYEMLSASLPMVFMPESVENMQKYGYDVAEFVAQDAKNVWDLMKRRRRILEKQAEWRRDYVAETRKQLRSAARKIGVLP